jgi:hypothetical protein
MWEVLYNCLRGIGSVERLQQRLIISLSGCSADRVLGPAI